MSDIPSRPSRPCTGCGRTLTRCLTFFHRDPSGADGLSRKCRDCRNEAERLRYARNAVEVRQRRREARVVRSAYFETTPFWDTV